MDINEFVDYAKVCETRDEIAKLSALFLNSQVPLDRSRVPSGYLKEIQYLYDVSDSTRKFFSKFLPVQTALDRLKGRMNDLEASEGMARWSYGIYLGYRGLTCRKVRHEGSDVPFMWRNELMNYTQGLYSSVLSYFAGESYNHNFSDDLENPDSNFEFKIDANGENVGLSSLATRYVVKDPEYPKTLWFDLPRSDVTLQLAAGMAVYGVHIFLDHVFVPRSKVLQDANYSATKMKPWDFKLEKLNDGSPRGWSRETEEIMFTPHRLNDFMEL